MFTLCYTKFKVGTVKHTQCNFLPLSSCPPPPPYLPGEALKAKKHGKNNNEGFDRLQITDFKSMIVLHNNSIVRF